MKPAVDINKLANNLNPDHVLTPEDREVYVPIYEDKLRTLRDMILNDEVEAQSFFVAGQAGTGKTTALNFFKNETLDKQYHIKYINMRDHLDLNDVDIIDFLLAFAFALVKETELEENYYKQLTELLEQHTGELVKTDEHSSDKKASAGIQADVSAGGGFFNLLKLKGGFFTYLRQDSNYRKNTRRVFKLKIPFLSQLVNEVIDDYVEKVTKGKKLLVVIDDLDKLQSLPQIHSIFIENRNYVFGMKCKKVISIPIHLARTPGIYNYSNYPISQLILRLTTNPIETANLEKVNASELIKRNKQLLIEVIKKRIAPDSLLIDDDALDEAIKFSGGIIRQLIRIIWIAAVEVRSLGGKKISLEDITKGIKLLKHAITGTITSSTKILMLNRILEKNIPDSEESQEFIQLLLTSNVLAYVNGNMWYEVNPIIRKTVEVYAARLQE